MNFNMSQMMQMMHATRNPQQFMMNYLKEGSQNNPFFSNLISLAEQGRGNEIESIARNIMREQGKDFDKEFNSFRRTMGL